MSQLISQNKVFQPCNKGKINNPECKCSQVNANFKEAFNRHISKGKCPGKLG